MQAPRLGIILILFALGFGGYSQEMPVKSIDTISYIQELDQKAIADIRKEQLDSIPEYLIKAKRLISNTDKSQYKALNAITIAFFYLTLENYDFAKAECNRALTLLEDLPPTKEEGYAYLILATVHTRIGSYEKAQEYLDKSQNTFEAIYARVDLLKVALNRGILAFEQDKHEKALTYISEALNGFNRYERPYYIAISNYMMAKTKLYLVRNGTLNQGTHLPEIKQSIETAHAIVERENFIDAKLDIYKVYSDLFMLENNAEKAFELYRLYAQSKDSITNNRMQVLNKYLNLENKEGELNAIIASQQKFLDQKQKSTWMNRITTWLSVFVIVILSLLTVALYKNNALRARTYKLLKDKNIELQLAIDKAEQASQAKSEFLSAVTHELRTPMYAITGLTQLLLDENPKEDQKEHLNSLKFSGEYLLTLINNILDLNKLEARKVELDNKVFGLKKLIEDVTNSFSLSLKRKNNTLHLEYDKAIPESIVGDPIVISQILINLIGNSVKFTENGVITIRAKCLESREKKTIIRFEIEDTGIGIPPKMQESIFESFAQGSVQINRKYGGTGLGLPIVKHLMTLLDTKIYLESQVNKGTKFYYDIAFGLPKEPKNQKNSQKASKESTTKKETAKPKGLHILLVEDNKINQLVTKKFLDKKDFQCTIIDNGVDAVEAVRTNHYDLILMDVHMPKMSGIEATKEIRKFNADIPIFALTALSVENNMSEFYDAGFNDVIPKPFKPEIFFEKIESAIS